MMETTQPIKRPIGMTILLVLSLANACMQIFGNLFMYITLPTWKEINENGSLEDSLGPLFNTFDSDMAESFTSMMDLWTSINPIYFLFTGLLFIGSLVGVIKMFKLQRLGFHVYSISQMLLLIVSVVYVYSHLPNNPVFSEFLTTVMFILIYHLYLKRIEFQMQQQNPDNYGQAEGE